MSKSGHSERAHSKFAASAAERWFNCPGSVALSEGQPDKESVYAKEGTDAHEVLENALKIMTTSMSFQQEDERWTALRELVPAEMYRHALNAAHFILKFLRPGFEISFEERVYLKFIDEEMFGTYDAKVVEYFGTLHVFDYKYGAGQAVSPRDNLQMLFYAIGLAHEHQWNFKKVRMWIIQPRIKGYDGPLFWEIGILELKKYVDVFKEAVANVYANPHKYVEGSWCHWCKAKSVCPVKDVKRLEKAQSVFQPIKGGQNGKKENQEENESGEVQENFKSEAQWKKEVRERKKRKEKVEADFY